MIDPIFGERRLAEIYDPLDPDRVDLDANEHAAWTVLCLTVLNMDEAVTKE